MTEPADLDVEQLRLRIEDFLLEGTVHLTRQEVAGIAGVPVDAAARLWRALGFPDIGDDVPAFADIDVEVLGLAVDLARRGILDETSQAAVTRTVGQAMSRLAEWQVGFLFSLITEQPELVLGGDRTVRDFIEEMVPILERFHTYAWRRHLDAFASRALTGIGAGRPEDSAVGFVDISGYTSLTRKLDAAQLGALLERFESIAADLVSAPAAGWSRAWATRSCSPATTRWSPPTSLSTSLHAATRTTRCPTSAPVSRTA